MLPGLPSSSQRHAGRPPPGGARHDVGQIPAAGCGELHSAVSGGLQADDGLVGAGSRDRAWPPAADGVAGWDLVRCSLAAVVTPGGRGGRYDGAGRQASASPSAAAQPVWCRAWILTATSARNAAALLRAPVGPHPARLPIPEPDPATCRPAPAGPQRHPGRRTQHRPANTHGAPHIGAATQFTRIGAAVQDHQVILLSPDHAPRLVVSHGMPALPR
jgi:hypothetical protein